MSWFSRAKSFVEGTTAKAGEVETEFDGIATAFNNLFQMGVEAATETLTLTGEYQDVPGATLELSAPQPSLLKVEAVLAVSTAVSGSTAEGTISVGGVDNEAIGFGPEGAKGSGSQVFVVSLATGNHTIKLRARRPGGASGGILAAKSTRFTYLLIPDPEP